MNNLSDIFEKCRLETDAFICGAVKNAYEKGKKDALEKLKYQTNEDIENRMKSWNTTWNDHQFELMEYAATTCKESIKYFCNKILEEKP